MFADSGNRNDDERENCYNIELRCNVDILACIIEREEGNAEPAGIADNIEVDDVVCGEEVSHDEREKVSAHKADKNRNRVEESLEEYRCKNSDAERYRGDAEIDKIIILRIAGSVCIHGFFYSGRSQTHADDDDDGADDYRRKGTVNPAASHDLDDECDDAVEKTCADCTAHCIRHAVRLPDGDKCRNECKRRSEKCRDFCSCDKNVQQRTCTCCKER